MVQVKIGNYCTRLEVKVNVPATGLRRPLGIRLRLRDFLDFRHYKDGKVVTLMHRPPSPPEVFWYSFLETESTPGHMVPSVASEKIPSDITGDRSRDPPASVVC